MRPALLSLCMMVKNEAHHLAECLDSVRDLTPELIVVDTGSTDDTARIARERGATVVPFDFSFVDFAAARNCSLAQAHGRWILVLDADETLDQSSLPLLQATICSQENAGYFLERRNTSTTDYVVRLFPNHPRHRYKGRVHETVDASILAAGGRLIQSKIRLTHKFCDDPEARRRKNHWYIEVLKEEIAADPADDSRLDFLAAEYHQLGMFDEAIAVAERIVQMRPNDARAHLFAGFYHLLYKPDYQQARRYLSRALELRPGYPEAQSFLGSLDALEAGGSQSSTLWPSAS
jgi:glycosyltransferase involved in cell wall biosynthesis